MAGGFIELRTNRLLLRPFRIEDAGDVFAFARDEEYAYFLVPGPAPSTRAEVETALRDRIRTPWEERACFAITLAGRVIGEVVLEIDRLNGIANLGYGVAREHWGQGLATEAGRAVVDYGFRDLQLAKIYARADPRNLGSIRVLEKLGMQREGLLRSHVIRRGERVDRVYYGLLRDEWAAGRGE
jgi:RimJ/RimL family protein N-acetyltransferase